MTLLESLFGYPPAVAKEGLALLTPREETVAEYVASGLSHKKIGEILEISPRTVQELQRRVCAKFRTGPRGVGRMLFLAQLANMFAADEDDLSGLQAPCETTYFGQINRPRTAKAKLPKNDGVLRDAELEGELGGGEAKGLAQ